MELPIFNDNLKSSGSWIEQLATDREVWAQLPAEACTIALQWQAEQIAMRLGQEVDSARLQSAVDAVAGWAAEKDGHFTLERLLEIHRRLIGASEKEDLLRKAEPRPLNAMHDPAPAVILPKMLDNAFDWFSTDSFRELHPVEAASVVYLRLLDLHPFPAHTEITSLLAAGYYTQKAGFPPLILYADEMTAARFAHALEAAFRMLTQPLVELFAEMLRRTMRSAGEELQ
jgi:Fic family protein